MTLKLTPIDSLDGERIYFLSILHFICSYTSARSLYVFVVMVSYSLVPSKINSSSRAVNSAAD